MKNFSFLFIMGVSLVVASCNFSGKKEKNATKNEGATKSCCASDSTVKSKSIVFNEGLTVYIDSVKASFSTIDSLRKRDLENFAAKIASASDTLDKTNLIFICTHNSRRSHMSQLWASVAASYYEIKDIDCFSGGTEATAFNPRAVKALTEAGFSIEKSDTTDNPVYLVAFAKELEPIKAFSKKFDDSFNPNEGFFAIMTCSQADEACPIVPGAIERIAIPYEDPKAFDGTPEESAMYAKRCFQIASEMFYVFSMVSKG